MERFEAVVGGMELANAFSELNDSGEQARRFSCRRPSGRPEPRPEEGDPDYVEAMSFGMPPNGGCGIGIDRLAMVLTGSDAIRDVILFPALQAQMSSRTYSSTKWRIDETSDTELPSSSWFGIVATASISSVSTTT